MYVGTILYGFCDGYFGRDSYSNKRIEAIGADWIVVRELDGYDEGTPLFCSFRDTTVILSCLGKWSTEEN
jgi:hypothetical protein